MKLDQSEIYETDLDITQEIIEKKDKPPAFGTFGSKKLKPILEQIIWERENQQLQSVNKRRGFFSWLFRL